MKTFIAELEHDCGIAKIKIVATDKETAKDMIIKSEGCPPWAIKTIKEVA